MSSLDEDRMFMAIHLARESEKRGEVPIGAVIFDADGKLIAGGSNQTIGSIDPTAHAEIVALRVAATRTNNYRLNGCTVYSTIEPCAMCAGALVNARVERLVYGARDERFGAVETHFRICSSTELNHQIDIEGGILEEKCRQLMQEFFRKRRA